MPIKTVETRTEVLSELPRTRTRGASGAGMTAMGAAQGTESSQSTGFSQSTVRPLHTARGVVPALSSRTLELLSRADAELVAAQLSPEPWERFTHAHLAALRAGAAVLAERQPLTGRRAPRTVWELLDKVAPELGRWSAFFAAGAGLRAAVDAGRFDAVSQDRADQVLDHAEDFLEVVRGELEAGVGPDFTDRQAG